MKSERAQSVLALLREFRVRGPYPSQAAAYRLEVVGLVVEKVKVLSFKSYALQQNTTSFFIF